MEAGHFSGATRPSTGAAPTWGKTATAYNAEYTTVTDPAGKTRRSRLDGLGRLVRVDEPTGSPPALGTVGSPNQATSYSYSALGNLTRVTQGSQTRTFAYDSLSRLTSAANPESGTIAYTYDTNGNLTQRTDARGVVTAYTYDRLDRPTRRSYSYTGAETAVSLETTRVDYAYDGCGSYSRGRLCSVTAKKGATDVSRTAYNRYDALGRVLESTQTTGGTSYTMAYAYDRAGNLTSQRYPSDRVVDYVYDGAGRIAGAKTGADGWYAGGTGDNAVGGVKQLLLGNGLWEQRRYNARLQPTQIGLGTAQATGGLTATGTRPTASVLLLDYSYGAGSNNGNVLSQRIRVGASLNQNQAYTYDALNRLNTAAESGSGAAWSQTYAYDRYGNRRVTAGAAHGSNQALTPQSTADIAAGTNRLAGTKGVNTVSYDAAGNLKADWAANAFKYDGDNRLVAFDAPLGTDSDTAYSYDGEGRRVRKVVGGSSGVATTYVYNVLGQLVAEFGGTAPEAGGTRYLTPDHVGSTRLVTGDDQSVLSRHDYLPFGEEISAALGNRGQATGVSGYTASLADGPSQKFTGKERDTESGLDYFGARYFSGAGGRFTSVDPYEINQEVMRADSQDQREELLNSYIGDPQVWNRYAYTLNNPLKYIDPDGLCPQPTDTENTVCISLYISTETSGVVPGVDAVTFRGDNRGPSPRSDPKQSRLYLWVNTKERTYEVHVNDSCKVSGACTSPSEDNNITAAFDDKGEGFTVNIEAYNSGISSPAIDATFAFRPDGYGGFKGKGVRDQYPAAEAYLWQGGEPRTLFQKPQQWTPLYLFGVWPFPREEFRFEPKKRK